MFVLLITLEVIRSTNILEVKTSNKFLYCAVLSLYSMKERPLCLKNLKNFKHFYKIFAFSLNNRAGSPIETEILIAVPNNCLIFKVFFLINKDFRVQHKEKEKRKDHFQLTGWFHF